MVSVELRTVVEGIYCVKEKAVLEESLLTSRLRSSHQYILELTSSIFFRNIVATFGNRVLLLGIGFFTSVLVARILGPEGRGGYAVAAAIGTIGVQLCNLGLHASNTYAVAKDRQLLSTLVMNSITVGVGFGGIVAGILGSLFYFWPFLAPLHGPLLWLGLFWIPLGLCYLFFQNLLLGIDEVNAYNLVELVSKVLSVLFLAAVLLYGVVTPEIVFVTGLIALGCSLAWTAVILRGHKVRFALPSLALFREHFGYSLRGYVAALFAFVALRLDLLIIQYLLGAEQTGYYSVAITLTDALYVLPITVGTILFPKLSGMASDVERWDFTKGVAATVGLTMIVIATAASLGSQTLITALYSDAFSPAAAAFVWLLPGIVVLSISSLLMNYLASVGMPPVVMYSSGAAAGANIILNLKLIPTFGIVGASVSMSLSAGIMLAILLIYIYRCNIKSSDKNEFVS